MSNRRDTYVIYSAGCAAVWATILVFGHRRLRDPEWRTLQTVCGGWWIGWTSATIARTSLPPPKPLSPRGATGVRTASIGLVALGLGNVVRILVTGRIPSTSSPRLRYLFGRRTGRPSLLMDSSA